MSDNVTDITVPILLGIRDDLRLVRDEQQKTNQRFDHLIDVMGGAHRNHEERIAKLEKRMNRLDRPRRTRKK